MDAPIIVEDALFNLFFSVGTADPAGQSLTGTSCTSDYLAVRFVASNQTLLI